VNGAVVERDDDSTIAIYGRGHSFKSILSGDVQAPSSTLAFMRSIERTAHISRVAEGKAVGR
jgi:lipid-binding SYLF domain-containing protein